MADISSFLKKILSAIYGEEVRGSIHDALAAMNTESSRVCLHRQGFRTGKCRGCQEVCRRCREKGDKRLRIRCGGCTLRGKHQDL